MWTHHVVFKYELYLNDNFLVYVLLDSGTGNIETVNEVMCVILIFFLSYAVFTVEYMDSCHMI
jgi:hypothetical protein